MNEKYVSRREIIIQTNPSTIEPVLEEVIYSQIKYQYVAVFVANIISYSHGYGVGWLSKAVPILESADTPLKSGPLTVEQISWLGGSYQLGAVTGDILFAVLLNYMGRKTSIMTLAIPSLIFWLIVLFSDYYWLLVIGRYIGGICGGGVLVVMPVFVAEIANKNVRGFLGIMSPLSIATGVLVAYICGFAVSYRIVPFCIIGFPIIFLILMTLIPETPHVLIRQGKLQKAEKSLLFYNNANSPADDDYNVKEELAKLQALVKQKEEEKRNPNVNRIFDKQTFKKLAMGVLLVALSMFSGIIMVTMNVVSLFRDSGTAFNPDGGAIIFGILQVCGVCTSSILVDRRGRRTLYAISSILSSLSLLTFGTYTYLNKKAKTDLSSVDWLPVASLSFYIFVNCLGMRTVPFLYIAEILPYSVRQLGVSICMSAMSSFAFLTVFTKPLLQRLLDLHVLIWIYSGICLLGFLFSIFLMVETKGKNLNRLQSIRRLTKSSRMTWKRITTTDDS